MTQYSTEVSLALGALRHKEFPLLSSPLRRNNLTANVINGTRIASVSHRTREQEPSYVAKLCSGAPKQPKKKRRKKKKKKEKGVGTAFFLFLEAHNNPSNTHTRGKAKAKMAHIWRTQADKHLDDTLSFLLLLPPPHRP